MGFEKFGNKSFTSQAKVAAFVDYLEQGEIRATRCKGCGVVYFPPRADCCKCLGQDMEWVPVTGSGRLVSFTCAHYAPTGFENDVPYLLAVVEFDGIKVFGRLSKDIPEEEVKVGMALKPVIVTTPEGQITYEFVAA